MTTLNMTTPLEKFIGAGGSVAQAVAGAGADFEVAAYLMNGGWSVEDALRDSTGEGMREAFAANLSLETVRSARADGYSLLVVARLVKWNVDEEVACSIASRVAPENAETVGVLISKHSVDVEEALLWGSLSGSVSNNPIFAYRDYDDLFVTPAELYDLCGGAGRILDALLARTVDVGTMHDFLKAAGVVRVGQALDWLESVNASGLEIAADRYESLLRAASSVLGAGLHLDVLEGPLQDGENLDELANFLARGVATVEQARAALDAGATLDAFGELLDNGWSVEEALFLAPSAAVVMPDSPEEYWAREERIDRMRDERIDYRYESPDDMRHPFADDMWHPFARHLWEGVPLEEVAARIAAGDEPETPLDRELRERNIQELRDAGVSDEHARQLEEAGVSAYYAKRLLDVRVPEGTPPMTVDDALFLEPFHRGSSRADKRREPAFAGCVAEYGVAGTRELLLKADLDVVEQLVRSASLSELLAAVDAGVDLQAVASFVSQGGTFAQYCDNSMLVVAELSAVELSSAEPTVSDPRRVIPVGARPATVTHAKGCGCVTCR